MFKSFLLVFVELPGAIILGGLAYFLLLGLESVDGFVLILLLVGFYFGRHHAKKVIFRIAFS